MRLLDPVLASASTTLGFLGSGTSSNLTPNCAAA